MRLVTRLYRRDRRRLAVATSLLAAPLLITGAVLPAAAWFGAPAAGADAISVTRQQIAQLQASAVAGAERIHALTAAYSEASFEASTLNREVGQARAEVAALHARSAQASSQLRGEAIDSYTGAYSGVPSVVPNATASDLAVRAEYVSVATGNLKESVDRLRVARSQLSAAQSQLAVQQQQANEAVSAAGQARQTALAEASADQAALNGLEGQLAHLVAAQQTQQQAQARVAAVAAHPATQGLPVNGGLVAAVQAAVQPAPAPAAPVPAAAPGRSLPSVPTTAAPTPTSSGSTAPVASSGDGGAGGVWLQLRECESGDDYQANTGNGYFGAYQFSQQTWTDLGFPGRPDQQAPATQDAAAQKLQAESGWSQWPACAAALGLS